MLLLRLLIIKVGEPILLMLLRHLHLLLLRHLHLRRLSTEISKSILLHLRLLLHLRRLLLHLHLRLRSRRLLLLLHRHVIKVGLEALLRRLLGRHTTNRSTNIVEIGIERCRGRLRHWSRWLSGWLLCRHIVKVGLECRLWGRRNWGRSRGYCLLLLLLLLLLLPPKGIEGRTASSITTKCIPRTWSWGRRGRGWSRWGSTKVKQIGRRCSSRWSFGRNLDPGRLRLLLLLRLLPSTGIATSRSRAGLIPGLVDVLAPDPNPQQLLVAVVDGSLEPLSAGIVPRHERGVDGGIAGVRLGHPPDLLGREGRRADALDAGVELAVDARAGEADERPVRQVDLRRELLFMRCGGHESV